MALLRLAFLSLILGAAIPLFFRALRFPLRLVAAGEGGRNPPAVLRFLGDLLAALFVALSFCIFLFWQADGIPRLFVFVAAALGALFVTRPLCPLLDTVEGRLILLLRRVLAPPLRLFLSLFSAVISVLRKIARRFIKKVKKHYTMLVSFVYCRREPGRTAGRRMRARIVRALGREE